MNLRTPCHNAELIILTVDDGGAYTSYNVPDEILCAEPDCTNSWNASGTENHYLSSTEQAERAAKRKEEVQNA